MRNSVIRIAMWESAGVLVAVGWGLYFASSNKANPIEPIVYLLVRLTQPLVALTIAYFNFPLGLTWIVIENAATYALIGLILETIRRRSRRLQISN
jgi:hypothetical protein